MTEYKILREAQKNYKDALDALEQKVSDHLTKGWAAVGGVSIVLSGNVLDQHPLFIVCQAIQKETTDND